MSKSEYPEEWLPMQAIDPDLVRRVADGEYEIDPHAVAEAMLRRSARLNELRRFSRVFVAGDVELPASGREQA
ncbi:MAG TPA: hypothetical protein VGI67_17820 [Thermoleophilaceae bacterium]